MKIKRAPLLGGIVILLIIILLSTTTIYYKNKNSALQQINNEQLSQIDVLESQNDELKTKISELENKYKQSETKLNKQHNYSEKVASANQEVAHTEGKKLGQFKITAYCSCSKCCGQWSGGPTASGVMPTEGRTIAVDPNVIPLGTQVLIDGHTYVAEDTGGVIKGNKIDLYFSSHQRALQWGVQYKNVSIVG